MAEEKKKKEVTLRLNLPDWEVFRDDAHHSKLGQQGILFEGWQLWRRTNLKGDDGGAVAIEKSPLEAVVDSLGKEDAALFTFLLDIYQHPRNRLEHAIVELIHEAVEMRKGEPPK